MNKKRNWLRLIIILSIVAIGALTAGFFLLAGKGPKVPEVEVTKIKRGEIVSTVTAEGELRAQNQVDISAEIVANVEKVLVEEGDFVEKGTLICLLEDDSLISERRLYNAQRDQAKAAFERGKALYQEDLSSLADYEALLANYEAADAQLEKSEVGLGKTRIYAPISGQVISVNIEVGETVMMGTSNNAGTVMFTLADLSAMQAEVNVDETDIVAVAPGQPAGITLDAIPDITLDAEVYSIGYMPSSEGLLSSGVTEFEVILDIMADDSALRPGMSASADITSAVREDVLTCPLQALGEKEIDGKPVETVFVLEKGTVKLVVVATGISDGASIEILSGIKEGQIIISGPYNTLRTLKDGDRVKMISGSDS